MKIAVTSKSFSSNKLLVDELRKKYSDVKLNTAGLKLSSENLINFLEGCDAAIIGLEKINSELLSKLPDLKIISKYGVGLDNIDFQAIEDSKVKFAHKPGVNKRGVAELALQMMLILLRKSYVANLALRSGSWNPLFGVNLTGKKIGILGLGHVGKELVKLLTPFDCELLACDLSIDKQFCVDHKIVSVGLEDLINSADVVTIHIPFSKSNKLLINERLLKKMKNGAILINTSRGGIVDEDTLYDCLVAGSIAAAGFDVFFEEPCNNKKLLNLSNFFSTPHIGGSSIESVLAMGLAAIEGLETATHIEAKSFI